METTLIRAIETLSVLAAVMTLGAGLGGIVGYLAMRRHDRRHKTAIHDRLHIEPVAMIDTQSAIRRAVQSDRSNISRKGWQTRRQRDARRAQQDADIRVLIGSDEGAR
jgi:hypothetical protein